MQEIELVVDADRYAEFLQQFPAGIGENIDCFTLDGEFDRHAIWRRESGAIWIHHAPARCMIRIGARGETITMIAAEDCPKWRSALLRVVRELATLAALEQGDLFIHGASVVIDGRAILLAGQKRSGKTSMLLNALRQPGAGYLSNDRVLIQLLPKTPVVRAMPTIVKIRPESLQHLPNFTPPVDPPRYRCFKTIQECHSIAHPPQPSDAPPPPIPAMSPAQLCRWIGVQAIDKAPLAAIVYPRVDPSVITFDLLPMTGDQAVQKLISSRFPCGVDNTIPRAFVDFHRGQYSAGAALEQSCAAVVQRIQSIDCRIGPAAFGNPNVWSAIMAFITPHDPV